MAYFKLNFFYINKKGYKKHNRKFQAQLLLTILIGVLVSNTLFSNPENKKKVEEAKIKINLEKAVLIGTTNSILLRTLEARKEIFKMLVTERWREFLPKVGIQYLGLRNVNINSLDNIYNDVRLTVQQLVYDGGEAKLNLETANLNEALNEKDFKIGFYKLKYEIEKNYFKALAAKGKVFIGKKSIEKMEEASRKAQTEYKQGFITKIALLETVSKLRQSQYIFQKYENEYNQSIHDLKQILSIDYDSELEIEENLFTDFVMTLPNLEIRNIVDNARRQRDDIAKSQIVVQKLKNDKEIADNYWMPKLYLGGYAGKNGDTFPLQHNIYGVNFNITLPLGSNVVQSTGSSGIQKDGTGIQTYPGFGNQFVGSGLNGYNSTNVQFFNNLSYSRKIVEGEVQLSEALLNYRALENQVGTEIRKSYDKINESWGLIRIANSRVLLQWEALKIATVKHGIGHAKKEDLLSIELEFLKAQEDLTDALSSYAIHCTELSYLGRIDLNTSKLLQYKKGQGNSLIAALTYNKKNIPQNETFKIENQELIIND
ncbi:TolC family protein [Leptospira alexanderi]|uniref:Outer membrane efflux protein n=1 Tax=Leptospira alexanderi serovar Manhao 3 str. L 60 TaxID=1049759 RepID=V6HZG5_9LEPT|nr:TolC family protein [Leptospira alexanderi]EQA62427.1 outer membrane efflux protein [Leptospira alexanderi serovar Manhao 3 str. L 60]